MSKPGTTFIPLRSLRCRQILRGSPLAWVSAVFLVGAAGASPFDPRPERLTPAQQEVWRATVSLEIRPWHHGVRASGKQRGSGLLVGADRDRHRIWIATASHVVTCARGCSVRLRPQGPGSDATTDVSERPARVTWRHRGADLALLEVSWPDAVELPEVVRPPRPGIDARPGDPVVAMGYPDLSGPKEPIGRCTKVFSTGRLEARREAFRAPVRSLGSGPSIGALDARGAWTHTAEILPGSSGGPLVSARGEILGLNVGSLATERGSCLRAPGTEENGAGCQHLAIDLAPLWQELERRGLLRAPVTNRLLGSMESD